MGMPDHHFHALIAHERVESLRATMLASRRRRRQRDEGRNEEAGGQSPRLTSLHTLTGRATLRRRPA